MPDIALPEDRHRRRCQRDTLMRKRLDRHASCIGVGQKQEEDRERNNQFEIETYDTLFGRIYPCRAQQPMHRIVEDIEMNPRNSASTSPPIVSLASKE